MLEEENITEKELDVALKVRNMLFGGMTFEGYSQVTFSESGIKEIIRRTNLLVHMCHIEENIITDMQESFDKEYRARRREI